MENFMTEINNIEIVELPYGTKIPDDLFILINPEMNNNENQDLGYNFSDKLKKGLEEKRIVFARVIKINENKSI